MSEGSEIDLYRSWALDFEAELKAERRAETILMLRSAVILVTVSGVAVLRALLL